MKKTATAALQINLSSFQPKHIQLMQWAADPHVTNILAAGGRRSGKTIALIAAIFMRAMRAPGSTHGFFHATRDSCKRNLFETSFPEALEILLPGWFDALKADKAHYVDLSDLEIRLPNGSKFMFLGLDTPHRARGLKFSTIMINEANFVTYDKIMVLKASLSEQVKTIDGEILPNKMIYDLNPTVKSSWDHKVFVEGVVPGDLTPLKSFKSRYRYLTINPIDNKANLPDSLFEQFEDLTEEQRRRDEHGMWSEDNPMALFRLGYIRRDKIDPQELRSIVVAVDPAGSSHKKSDLTGIIVAGRTQDGFYHVLEDATLRGKPEQWAQAATDLYHKYSADWIVAEKNCGGEMVQTVLERATTNGRNIPIKLVHASRNKRARAETIQPLYAKGGGSYFADGNEVILGRVYHSQVFTDLEQQMLEFDSPHFKGSPDRVDALVWALTFLSEQQSAPSPAHHYPTTGLWS